VVDIDESLCIIFEDDDFFSVVMPGEVITIVFKDGDKDDAIFEGGFDEVYEVVDGATGAGSGEDDFIILVGVDVL